MFHNRRMDADIRTLKKVLDGGRLGKLWRLHSRIDSTIRRRWRRARPAAFCAISAAISSTRCSGCSGRRSRSTRNWIGSNCQRGRPTQVRPHPAPRQWGSFTPVGKQAQPSRGERIPRLWQRGGSYVSSGADVQAQAIFAGRRPAYYLANWGYEDEALWGALHIASGVERIASEQGRYHDYYEGFARAVRDGVPPPVTAAEAVATLAVLDAARVSAQEGRTVAIRVGRALRRAASRARSNKRI